MSSRIRAIKSSEDHPWYGNYLDKTGLDYARNILILTPILQQHTSNEDNTLTDQIELLERLSKAKLLRPKRRKHGRRKQSAKVRLRRHEGAVFERAARITRQLNSYKNQLRRLKQIAKKAPVEPRLPPDPVGKNLGIVSEALGLSGLEKSIILFLFAAHQNKDINQLLRIAPSDKITIIGTVIAAAINRQTNDVLKALDRNGGLVNQGLVAISDKYALEQGVLALDRRVQELILSEDLNASKVLETFLPVAQPASLTPDDFSPIENHFKITKQIILAAREGAKKGVNILIYGPTGVGKTELARLLAQETECRLHVAGTTGIDYTANLNQKTPPNAFERLTSLRIGQNLLAKSKALIAFDEMEDLFFERENFGFMSSSRKVAYMSKQWFNELLETNAVPVIWISNDVRGVDPAFLRRFSYAIEMKTLNAQQRKRVWTKHIAGDLPQKDVDYLSHRYTISPGQINTVVTTARLLDPVLKRDSLETIIAPTEKLVSGKKFEHDQLIFDPSEYLPEIVNTPVDLKAIADKLAEWKPSNGPVTMAFYGVSGSGKSEYARYIAYRMDRPLYIRRVSDIISMWLGQSEQNIARAFQTAEEDGSVLCFDEADSFLRDRRNAVRSWEVTEVNEFLQQLERFRGVCICTTNLYKDLDQAVLRRFSFKIPFEFLKPMQSEKLFYTAFAKYLPFSLAEEDKVIIRSEFSQMSNLAPGDFAAVNRRLTLLGMDPKPTDLLKELRVELEGKESKARRAGF